MGRIYHRSWRRRKALAFGFGVGLVAAFVVPAFGQQGTIEGEIQIDKDADLWDYLGDPWNVLAELDWVLDPGEPNGPNDQNPPVATCLGTDGVATCNQTGVTAVASGPGTWNGVRVVDSAGTNEQDIFLGSSHFNDVNSWKVGKGSIGGAKYDASEAYIANNSDYLFMGMERLGYNGSTAWDFEFNAKHSNGKKYVPERSPGDKLFVFEMSESGGGSVTPYLYEWDGTEFDPIPWSPDDPNKPKIYATINTIPTLAGPWGYRDTKGQWKSGNLPALTFGEVGLPIGEGGIQPPDFDPTDCSQKAYVSIRTRASNEFTSDMKDALPIFEYKFGGLSASAVKYSQDPDKLEVKVKGTISDATATRQWQVWNYTNNGWEDIGGQTGEMLTFPTGSYTWNSTYATEKSAGAPFMVPNDSDSFVGKVLTAKVRVVASQSVGGEPCSVGSSAVEVKKLLAVDP